MSQSHYRKPEQREVENPSCRFTGEDLVGTIGIHYGGSNGVDHEEVPMAAAEYYRRRDSDDDSVPTAPGMTVTPLYRASLPDDELELARRLRHTDRSDFDDEDWGDLLTLTERGWKVKWHPTGPHTDDTWCELYKPFDDDREPNLDM